MNGKLGHGSASVLVGIHEGAPVSGSRPNVIERRRTTDPALSRGTCSRRSPGRIGPKSLSNVRLSEPTREVKRRSRVVGSFTQRRRRDAASSARPRRPTREWAHLEPDYSGEHCLSRNVVERRHACNRKARVMPDPLLSAESAHQQDRSARIEAVRGLVLASASDLDRHLEGGGESLFSHAVAALASTVVPVRALRRRSRP